MRSWPWGSTPSSTGKPAALPETCPQISISPASWDFGSSNPLGSKTFTVTNDGTNPTTLAENISGPGAFKVGSRDTCAGATLAAGGSCVVIMEFTQGYGNPPCGTSRNGSISYTPDGMNSQTVTATFTGAQTPCPVYELTWSPTSNDFGTAAGSDTFTLTNTGNQPVTISTAQETPATGIDGGSLSFSETQTTSCAAATPLAVGASCTVDATFVQASSCGTGSFDASVDVTYFTNAADTTTATATATAAAQQTPCDLSIVAFTPAQGSTTSDPGVAPTATFNQAVLESSVGFVVRDSSNVLVLGAVTVTGGTLATFTPSSPLTAGETYTATVSGAQSTGGVPMSGSFNWSFTIANAPPG